MTNREAALKSCKDRFEPLENVPSPHCGKRQRQRAIELEKVKIEALRPVTREQVEKMRGKFFQAGIDDVAQDTWRCSRCVEQGFGNVQGINFCPSCDAAMTDEAVDMAMGRLEALHGKEENG